MGRVNLSHPEEEAITQKPHKVKELHDFEGKGSFLLQNYSHRLLC